jgi:Domain of unknown function (DUF4157)
MVTPATKTSKVVTTAPQKAGATFFRKAGEPSFFGAQNPPSFFNHPVQAKLTVSTPDDAHEKEADSVADKVMRMPAQNISPATQSIAPGEKIERKEEELQAKAEPLVVNRIQRKEDNEERLHAKPAGNIHRMYSGHSDEEMQAAGSGDGDHTIHRKNISLYHSDVIQRSGRGPPQPSIPFQQNLSASKGAGSKLPGDTSTFMESRFNADFSSVRVHTGTGAEQMSSHVQAKAFTHGSDIYFNQGQYSPDSSGGRLLLAHELTHTIQQGTSPVSNPVSRKPATTAPADSVDLSNKSGGATLPDEAKKYFKRSFKADVGDIRIHTDDEAASICRSRRVPAFTQGIHICFDPARYSADSDQGAVLLAKQVSASLSQRSINVPGLAGRIDGAVNAGKPAAVTAKSKKATDKKSAKDKKEKDAKGKSAAGGKKKGADSKHKVKKKGDKGDGPPVKAVKPNPKKSPSKPDEDPAFQRVVGKTKTTAEGQKHHEPAESKSTDAQKASPPAPKEAESKAKERKTDGIDAAGKEDKPFDAKAFKAELLKKIEDVTPKTLEDATEFKENNKVSEVKGVMGDKVAGEKQDTTGPVANATAQPLQVNDTDNKHPAPLPPTPKGPAPAGVGAQDAAPKPKLDNEISLEGQSKSLDDEMKANNVTEDQLAKSNEPSFTAALDQKKGAQKDAVEKPKQYRKDETLMLGEAKGGAQVESTHALAGMDTARGKNFALVVQQQQTTKQKDHLTRADVAKDIEAKYAAAEAVVKKVLDEADKESNRIFDEGSEAARNEFENYVDGKMSAYKRERYSGFWGGLSWLEDKVFGMPDEVNVFYTQGRQLYLDSMDRVITRVANYVTTKLNEAKQAIKDGKKHIDDYVAKLPKDLAEVGKQASSDIQDKFDSLEQSVNDKKDQLVEGLAKKYVDNVKKIDDRIDEMKEANAGLIDKAIGFLKKIWKVIKDLTNLFTSILSKLAAIIGTILSSPGGFFDNLGKAFKQGFNNFKDKFLDYLEQGLMDWLSTNLGIAGIELPKEFSVTAIFTLVLQVLGLTKQHIKERAVAILGERKVKLLETAGGILYRVYNEGLGALWDMIKEKLTDLKDVIWEAIKSFIKTKIIEAAIIFLLSMLNPIGAFIKVCMAIYDFLMMLVRFKDRIMELLDSILKAVTDVASGAIDGAANAIEKAFAKSIPVIIGFLAALLHLNDIAAKVRDIITRIRARVDKAIDFVITKADEWVGKYVEGALKLQDKGAAMVEKGKQAVIGAGKKVLGFLGFKKVFKDSTGEQHSLFFEGDDHAPRLMVATEKKEFLVAVKDRRAELEKKDDTLSPEQKKQRTQFKRRLTDSVGYYNEMKDLENKIALEQKESEKAKIQREIFRLLDSIIDVMTEVGVTDYQLDRKVLAAPVELGDYIKKDAKVFKLTDMTPGVLSGNYKYDFKATDDKGGAYYGNFVDYNRLYFKVTKEASAPQIEEAIALSEESPGKYRSSWNSYPEARKALNYRRTGFPLNSDDAFQWEHTVEQSSKVNPSAINKLSNISWTSKGINQEANRLYATTLKSELGFLPSNLKEKLYRDIDGVKGNISIREYLVNVSDIDIHLEFKNAYYRFKGVSIQSQEKGRGPFNVLN